MIDTEVVRLRKLRSSALRVRAVARALSGTRSVHDDPVLDRAACAAWRVARAVSGRLRAHPYVSFQQDAGFGVAFANALAAAGAVVTATSRARAFRGFGDGLRTMLRELDDARALTWTPDLSDAFGRSLAEFRPLLALVESEARHTSRQRRAVVVARGSAQAAGYAAAPETDWPYLAL